MFGLGNESIIPYRACANRFVTAALAVAVVVLNLRFLYVGDGVVIFILFLTLHDVITAGPHPHWFYVCSMVWFLWLWRVAVKRLLH